MIVGFRDNETHRIFEGAESRRFPPEIQDSVRRKLGYLDSADELRDLLAPAGNRLEKLKGDREGQYSIRVNDQWRICFWWSPAAAHDVELVDYHRGWTNEETEKHPSR